MAKPRSVLRDQYYLISRRCSERRFFLRPDDATNAAFWYCLGFALGRTKVRLIAAIAMSNHVHLVVHDAEGNIPDFLQRFHQLLARSQNCYRGRWEAFWAAEQTSRVRLVNAEDVVRKVAYALANPVAAHLVDTAAHWPGASSWSALKHNHDVQAKRPRHFFRDKMPAAVTVQHAAPMTMTREEFWSQVEAAVQQYETDAAEVRRREGKKILGRSQVCKQSPYDRPSTTARKRGMSPRVACISKWHRIEALQHDKAFHAAYVEARGQWISGARPVFPAGTWALRRVVKVEGLVAPPAAN